MHVGIRTILLLISFGLISGSADVPQTDLSITASRIVDVTSQIAKTTTEYDVKNNGQSPVSWFLHGVSSVEASHISWVVANADKKDGKRLKIGKTSISNAPADVIIYKVELASPIAPGASAKIIVRTEATQFLTPHPKNIAQSENQYVVYNGNAHLVSPYVIEKQTTSVKVGTGKVLDYTKVESASQQSDQIKYGSSAKIAAYSKVPIRVHYENNSPFLVVKELKRWIEVSHWGSISVEDVVEVEHRGALLKGSYSRLDYQMDRRGGNQPVVKSFKTRLPSSARDIYYRDQIGNISTSIVAKRANRVEVELRPRFPLFGGWKTNYILGYTVPSVGFLHASGSDFALKIPFIDHIYDNAVIEKATVRIVLPEAARNAKVVDSFGAKRLPDELHKTYLDTTGRLVIVLENENLVNSHVSPVTIYYEFDRVYLLREPLIAVAAFFLLFLTVIIFVRLDFSISEKPEVRQKKD